MFKKLFTPSSTQPEDLLRKHNRYSDAYKIVGQVLPSKDTFEHDGIEVSYNIATLLLAVKPSYENTEYFAFWKSNQYKTENDASAVLNSECTRLADIVSFRIEIVSYSLESGLFEISKAFNKKDQRYLLAESEP